MDDNGRPHIIVKCDFVQNPLHQPNFTTAMPLFSNKRTLNARKNVKNYSNICCNCMHPNRHYIFL